MTPDWAAVRREFPALERWTYLNTATYGQMPRCARQAMLAHLDRRDEGACADFLEWFDDADGIRDLVARLIGCRREDVAFTVNAASALAVLLQGLDWKPGDRIVTLEHEFPNNLYLASLCERFGVEFIETTWEEMPRVLATPARLVALSTVNYVTGFRVPLARLRELARSAGALLYLDGTQSVGALRMDVAEAQPDLLAVHGYKWLLSPNGAAFFYITPELRDRLRPNVVGWRSDKRWREVDNLTHGAPSFVEAAEKYEGGMLNFPGLYAMGAAIQMIVDLGVEAIECRVLNLAEQTASALRSRGASILHAGTPILAARFPGQDPSRLAQRLREEGVLVSARHGFLRISTHFYNNNTDIERLTRCLG